ncbi:hypothetical protein [Spongiactinospora sp. TRM90649]|uniref:hypothetical protein n=1 Tax=Spongiactinospora sp. TRM90649 TaxID=3031114 RepID=UPI0023F8613D|nr:hypothetical protein [Spongiactinospora sp. TRM90649]MDF5751038.1 hypothetical protein [Spongiactinospora sp. TRM90649]
MSPLGKYYIGAAIASVIILMLPLPALIGWIIVIALLGGPAAAYYMLDPSQRERLRRVNKRRLGR